jgi:hypothetical protein
MAKVSAMQAQLEAAAGRNAPTEAATAAPSSVAKPKSREGRVHVGAWLPEAYSRNILLVRAQTGLSVKAIFAKALNDLFLSHNIPVIDEE